MAEKKFKCPVCNSNFELETDLEVGDTTDCPECYADLRIVSFAPPVLEEVVNNSFDDEEESYDDEEN